MLRKSITAAIIAATEIVLTLDWWDGLIKTLMAAVALWWIVFLLLIGMEEEKDAESIQRDSKAPERKHRAA